MEEAEDVSVMYALDVGESLAGWGISRRASDSDDAPNCEWQQDNDDRTWECGISSHAFGLLVYKLDENGLRGAVSSGNDCLRA